MIAINACLRLLFLLSAVCFLAIGLWNHDWLTISFCLVFILFWPAISRWLREDADEVARLRELDRLWDDDDDLSESA